MVWTTMFERSRTKVHFPERVYRLPGLGEPNEEEPSTNSKRGD